MRYRYLFYFLLIFFGIASCANPKNNDVEVTEETLKEELIQSIYLTNELEFEKAFTKLQLLEKTAHDNNFPFYEVAAHLNIGVLYSKFNENEQALNYYLSSLTLAEKNKVEVLLNSIYNNIGILYSKNQLYIEALDYINRALDQSRNLNSPHKEAINLINIATVKEKQNQLDSALIYNEIALEILVENEINNYTSTIYNNIGEIHFKENNFSSANKYFFLALTIENSWEEESSTGNVDQTIIGLYTYNIGRSFVQIASYDSAKYYLSESLIYLKKAKNSELVSDAYYWLAKNEETKMPNTLSKEYYDECISWKDSVLFQNKEQFDTDVQLKYEFGKIEKELDFLEERDQVQKRIIFFIVLISIVFIVFILSIWKSRNRNLKQRNVILNNEKEIAKVEKERNEVERIKLAEEMESQMQLNKIKEEKIKLELEHKSKEVVSNAIHLMNKNEILKSLLTLVEKIELEDEDTNKQILTEMKSSIKNNINQDKAWEDFKLHFDEVHESFNTSLYQKHPDLSPTDFRLCAYLLIGLNSKEIAHVSNISPESVRKRKQRLRQKLDLDSSIALEDYLKSL